MDIDKLKTENAALRKRLITLHRKRLTDILSECESDPLMLETLRPELQALSDWMSGKKCEQSVSNLQRISEGTGV